MILKDWSDLESLLTHYNDNRNFAMKPESNYSSLKIECFCFSSKLGLEEIARSECLSRAVGGPSTESSGSYLRRLDFPQAMTRDKGEEQ